MRPEQKIFKALFALGSTLLLAMAVAGIAQLLAFLNSGNNREGLLKTANDLPDEYVPKVVWLNDSTNAGRPIEAYNQTAIARNYVKALYQRNLSMYSGEETGLKEYFTPEAQKKVAALVHQAKDQEVLQERAELNHHLKLAFYSADGQLAAFTDYAVESLERVSDLQKNRLVFSHDTADYQVIMEIIDGYWKVKHLQRNPVSFASLQINQPAADTLALTQKAERLSLLPHLKGLNYYPQKSPFKDFWINYDSAAVEKDFHLIRQLNANAVRVFVNFEQFGKGNVVPEMLLRLEHLLNTAQDNELKVIITLFDFNSDYNLFNYPATDRQLETILTYFRNHEAILAYDLKNEPDIDYHYQNPENVQDWLRFIVRQAKQYDANHPLTIGWAYPENADFLAQNLDFVSFHYYKDLNNLGGAIDALRAKIGPMPLAMTETGLSSYQSMVFPIGKSEAQQAEHLYRIKNILKNKGDIPFFYWTLYDFTEVDGDVAGKMPWQRNAQKHFGLINKDGKLKKAATYFATDTPLQPLSFVDKIQPYQINYLVLGLIFITLFTYRKRIFKRLN